MINAGRRNIRISRLQHILNDVSMDIIFNDEDESRKWHHRSSGIKKTDLGWADSRECGKQDGLRK